MAAVTEDKSAKAGLVTDETGSRPPPGISRYAGWIYKVPWWALMIGFLLSLVAVLIVTDQIYGTIFDQLKEGLILTLRVSFISYSAALVIGLVLGVIRSTTPKPQVGFRRTVFSLLHLIAYQLATFFVEVMRGLPILIVLLISAFVATPAFKDYMEETFNIVLTFRGSSEEVAIAALALAYGAFLSEVFRAGIQSIEKGQVEAARSLGMTNFQTLRFIVLPQATRRVVPPLGNDFIAMIKDSSLVSIFGLRDVTQIGKLWAGSTFRFEETYLVVAVLYLSMTVLGSIIVRFVEQRMKSDTR